MEKKRSLNKLALESLRLIGKRRYDNRVELCNCITYLDFVRDLLPLVQGGAVVGELGKKLKEARENKGLSLREVEEATKIRKKYLQALENEKFEEIPGRTYAKGFLKNYSSFLGLDTKELIGEFEELVYNSFKDKDYTPARIASSTKPKDRESKLFKYGLVVAAVLVLFIASSLLNSDSPDPIPPPVNNSANNGSDTPPANTSEKPEVHPEQEETTVKEITGVNLAIEIIKDQCWISVISDGSKVFSGTLNQGDKRMFEGASEILVTFGNAGVAKVTYNGEELAPLGAEGEVVTPPPFVAKTQPQA